MVEPAELLQNLRVLRIPLEHAGVGHLGGVILRKRLARKRFGVTYPTYILLLLVHVADLEIDVLFTERSRRVIDDVFEALEVMSEPTQTKRSSVACSPQDWNQTSAVVCKLYPDGNKSRSPSRTWAPCA